MMDQVQRISVYILSDSVGETAQYVARAAANQFPGIEVSYKHIPFVEDAAYITEVLERIDPKDSILCFTLVVEQLRQYVIDFCKSHSIQYFDILDTPFQAFEALTGQHPVGRPGLVQRMDESYFKKIEAMEFAIKYDDGKDVTGIIAHDDSAPWRLAGSLQIPLITYRVRSKPGFEDEVLVIQVQMHTRVIHQSSFVQIDIQTISRFHLQRSLDTGR